MMSAKNGLTLIVVASDRVTNAARIARSPCARFTNRIAPNASDKPVANNA